MHISCFVFAALCGGLFLSSHILCICQCFFRCNGFVGIFLDISFFNAVDFYECFRYKFSQSDGRRRIFSFYRKISKLALALVSDSLRKFYHLTQFALL